jgi:ribonuclease P/MRP protein subunit POP5
MGLMPSLRQKKRYVVFEIISDQKFSLPEVKTSVDEALRSFLGQLGMGKAAPIYVDEKFDQEAQKFLLKVNNKFVDEIKMGVALCKSIKNTPVIIKSVIVSGSIKKAGEKSKAKN